MADDKKKDDKKKDEKPKDAKKDGKSEGEGEASAAVAAPKKGKMMLAIGGVVALLVVIGAPVAFFALKKDTKETEELAADAIGTEAGGVPEGAHDSDEAGEDEEALGAIYPLETFVVNLAGGKFVRAQVQLEFSGRDVPTRFYTRVVPVRDGIIALLTKRTKEDIESAKGKETLKVDIRDTVNDILKREEVRSVYFTQFLIQG